MSKSIEQRSMMSVGVVLAVLGGLALMSGPGVAEGQNSRLVGDRQEVPFNATAQRVEMVKQMQEMNRRLAAIESSLNSGLSVKVTEMPAVHVQTPKDD